MGASKRKNSELTGNFEKFRSKKKDKKSKVDKQKPWKRT